MQLITYTRSTQPVRPWTRLAPLCGLALALTAGCDSGPKTAYVSGTVSYNGRPVEEGTISFYPIAGGRPAIGKIQPDGTFVLTTFAPGDGAVLGDHKVSIEAKQVMSPAPQPVSFQEELAQEKVALPQAKVSVKWLVPQEFASTESSGLTATVVAGENEVNFALP